MSQHHCIRPVLIARGCNGLPNPTAESAHCHRRVLGGCEGVIRPHSCMAKALVGNGMQAEIGGVEVPCWRFWMRHASLQVMPQDPTRLKP